MTTETLEPEIKRAFPAVLKSQRSEPDVYPWTISTVQPDLDGEVMVPKGCVYREFVKSGGAMYWNHDQSTLPVAMVKAIRATNNELEADVVFPPRPESFAEGQHWGPDYMRALVDSGMVKAVSIGARRLEGGMRMATSSDVEKYGSATRMVTNKWRLFEVSFTTAPVNTQALRKSMGSLDPRGLKSLFGIEITMDESPAPAEIITKHRVQIVVPQYGAADRIATKAANEIARRRGRVWIRDN